MPALRRREVLAGLAGTLGGAPFLTATRAFACRSSVESITEATPYKVLSTEAVDLQINFVGGNVVNFGYSTLAGSQPNSFGNTVFLWAVSGDAVPWNSPALASAAIIGDTPEGDQNLTDISITDNAYLLGYAIGPRDDQKTWSPYRNVVASAYIPGARDTNPAPACTSANFSLKFLGTTSLVYQFGFLSGFMARASGAWVGLWANAATSWTVPPKWFGPIDSDGEAGTSGLNGIQITRKSTYALGLFSGGYDCDPGKLDLKRLACSVTFST